MNRTYVSRGGEKLESAFKRFQINVEGKVCADFGCSTGGFTHFLLSKGAVKVYCVDTAYGELNWKLRNDPRVVVMERTNALHVKLPESVDLIVIDVGWTPQAKVLPNAVLNLKSGGKIISLVKPFYEYGHGKLTEEKAKEVFLSILQQVKTISGLFVEDSFESSIVGTRGKNTEFLVIMKKI